MDAMDSIYDIILGPFTSIHMHIENSRFTPVLFCSLGFEIGFRHRRGSGSKLTKSFKVELNLYHPQTILNFYVKQRTLKMGVV